MTTHFIDLNHPSSAASISSASHSTSSPIRSKYTRGRDQQIFRRAGSPSASADEDGFRVKTHDVTDDDNIAVGQGASRWPQQQQRRSLGYNSSEKKSQGGTEWPDSSASFHAAAHVFQKQSVNNVQQQQLRQQPLSPQFNMGTSSNSTSSMSLNRVVNTHATTATRTSSTSTTSTNRHVNTTWSAQNNKSLSSQTTTSQSSTKPNNARGGVVTKLVSLFSNKSNNPLPSKATTTRISSNPASRTQTTSNQNNNFNNTQNDSKSSSPSNAYPAISPVRSTAQSSVSGESSYNPTGWPGTVDKRGKLYVMESSYSEDESSSGLHWRQQPQPQHLGLSQHEQQQHHSHGMSQKEYVQRGSFDGASQAELEDWIRDDTSRKGPIDLDEVYHQRGESLENKSAANFHLEAALRTNSNHRENSLGRPYQLGKTMFRDSSLHSPESVGSSLDEESIRRGIDTSWSEDRVRASGRKIKSIPVQQRRIYDDEVDFGECDDEVGFDEFSPDDLIAQQSSQSRFHQQSSSNRYDDEVDFEYSYSPDTTPRIQPPTEEALRLNNSRSAPPRPGGSAALKGYRGFIDKTRDVPNLMDDLDSEANTSLGTNAERRALGLSLPPASKPSMRYSGSGLPPCPSSVASSNVDSGSDVFEGIAGSSVPSITSSAISGQRLAAAVTNNLTRGPQSFISEYESFDPKMNRNPFRQQQKQAQSRQASNTLGRKVDFVDPSLNLSAVSKGSEGAFSQHDIVDLDDFVDDIQDLSMYCVSPESVRLMVRAFRKMCTMQMEISSCEDTMLSEFEELVDTKKRFALFEMRSRIMETDIDRGLERRGGTNVVDDIVLTPYFQAMHRVRDAVIVSKAWRDGATPKDVVTAHLLTRRSAKSHFVKRPIQRIRRPGAPSYPQFWLEEVLWLDETDFAMMRCQSLGAGTMKGFEMFTIGDCQSILLKMTSDNCTQLRRELRSAMMCQIEAEEVMQEEIDFDGDQHVVAEAEQLYRDATIEVKQLSMKLVLADKAFSLVRSRMEKLVETIESLLVHIENGDEAPDDRSSSTEDDDEEDDYDEEQEREKLVERAKRAEMSAELAIRESLLAKEEAEKIKSEKQREIDDLKNKLAEMETQSQHLASRYSSILAGSSYLDKIDAKSILEGSFDRDMEDARQAARDRAKLKFRERRVVADNSPSKDQSQPRPISTRGEEIYQSLDFYSRSLNSVQRTTD